MRLPVEIAMEVGSFLDGTSLRVCTTQLCWSGVGFVSRPCTDSATVTTIQLHKLVELCRTTSCTLAMGQEQANGLVAEAVKRIDQYLARRNSAEKVAFVANLTRACATANTGFYSDIHRHYSLISNLPFENGPSLAVEWHAHARSLLGVMSLLGERNGGCFNDGCLVALCQSLHTLEITYDTLFDVSALASCHALHTLYLTGTKVSDVSALSSCPTLHTLHLNHTFVSDVSPLASCPTLHTLNLTRTRVSDVSPLASCQALHTLNLTRTGVSDVSALASCEALHTLNLTMTEVSDVSALAACQALHTLQLDDTQVSDVSALTACGSLRYLRGAKRMIGYESIVKLLKDRR
jgi:hypothetical protein